MTSGKVKGTSAGSDLLRGWGTFEKRKKREDFLLPWQMVIQDHITRPLTPSGEGDLTVDFGSWGRDRGEAVKKSLSYLRVECPVKQGNKGGAANGGPKTRTSKSFGNLSRKKLSYCYSLRTPIRGIGWITFGGLKNARRTAKNHGTLLH